MKNKHFLILKWVDFFVILFAIFANSRLGMSDTLTSIIIIIGLAFIILISIIEKSIIKNEGTKYTKNLALFIIILIIMASILYFLMFSKTKNVDGKDIDFSIDHISAKEAVCVGKIKLEKGINYKINISIESGDKIFVALNVLDDITNAQGVEWKQYFETSGKKLEHIFTDMEIGEFYVYVGSKGEDLNKVEGSLSIIE